MVVFQATIASLNLKTTLETSEEDTIYTRKRVKKIQFTLEMSGEDITYTNEWRRYNLNSKRVKKI